MPLQLRIQQAIGLRALQSSFSGKVAAVALLTVGVALTLGFGSFVLREWRVERQEMVERRTTIASVMAANVAAPLVFKDGATAETVLRSSRGVPYVLSVSVFNGEGMLFSHHGPKAAARPAGVVSPRWRFTRELLEVRVPVRADGDPVGELVLVSSLEGLHRTFIGYAVFAGLMFLTVGAAAVRIATVLARRVIEPVNHLSSTMQAIRESGDFARPVEPGRDAELARLAHEFNALLAELARRNTALVAAREEAEAGNRAKTQFLANMSHELRTPLNALVGLAPLLASEPLSVTQQKYLFVMERSAESLLQLLSDVLDAANLESGRLTLDDIAFDPWAVVRETCAIFQSLAAAKGLRLVLDQSVEVGGAYRGDPVRLRQLLTNLVSNAVQFTPTGEIRVRFSRDRDHPGLFKLVVADTGVGIPQEKIPLLFEKFAQADFSTTRTHGGSGLGLAICRELTELMGGSMEVESRVGHGSVFTARFALVPVEGDPAMPKPERRMQPALAEAG